MTIERLQLSELRIPFKTTFRHAAAERSETSSIWVETSSGALNGYGEACPRPYVTGETIDSARTFFDTHRDSVRDNVVDLDSLRRWMSVHAAEIGTNPAAWCAIELAVLDILAKTSSYTIEAFLALPPLAGRFRYTAVLGDASSAAFTATAEAYRRMGFTDFKVKLSGDAERDRAKIAVLQGWALPGLRVRVDANNLWRNADAAVPYLRALDHPFFGVEEPIGSQQYVELACVAESLGCRIILDESFVDVDQFRFLDTSPERWVINVRVSKMGGLLRSLGVVSAARARGIPVVVGAQVGETSLLTRAALTIAQAAGPSLVAQEGAFGTFLLEHDVCDPPLMFGAGGALDVAFHPSLTQPGLGIQLARPVP